MIPITDLSMINKSPSMTTLVLHLTVGLQTNQQGAVRLKLTADASHEWISVLYSGPRPFDGTRHSLQAYPIYDPYQSLRTGIVTSIYTIVAYIRSGVSANVILLWLLPWPRKLVKLEQNYCYCRCEFLIVPILWVWHFGMVCPHQYNMSGYHSSLNIYMIRISERSSDTRQLYTVNTRFGTREKRHEQCVTLTCRSLNIRTLWVLGWLIYFSSRRQFVPGFMLCL